MSNLIVVDVEADGPFAPDYSMVCFGAVALRSRTNLQTFYGTTRPISDQWIPEALAVSGITREQHQTFDEPTFTMTHFADWLTAVCQGKPIFISDNPAFDFKWIDYYFYKYYGTNPFGHSGRRIGDLYCGLKKDMRLNREWKQKLRITKHTHNPIDDAMGNAEALIAMSDMGIQGIL